MAKDIDASLINEAIDFYYNTLREKKLKNPHSFPSDPSELAVAIQQAALRLQGKPYMDRISAKLERLANEAIDEIPTTGVEREPLDPGKVARIQKQIDLIRKQYEPIPEDADGEEYIKHVTREVSNASMIAALMLGKYGTPMNYAQAIASPQFKKFEQEIERDIAEDSMRLKNDPMWKRYKEDYPFGADVFSATFSPGSTAVLIPIREVLAHGFVLAEDPDVRARALDFSKSLFNGTHEEAFDEFVKSAGKSLEKAYYSRDIKDRRLQIDIVLGLTLANPAVLQRLGMPAAMNTNLVWKSMQGIKSGAVSLKESSKGTIVEHIINTFRDRHTVQKEKFIDNVFSSLRSHLGKESYDDLMPGIMEKYKANLETMYGETTERFNIAERIFKSINAGTRELFADLSPAEQVAVVYRQQGARDQAPDYAKKVMDSERVVATTDKVGALLKDILAKDLPPGVRSGYWPYIKKHVDTVWDAIKYADVSSYKMKREVVDVVHASLENIGERIDDLSARLAAPYINAMKTKASTTAETAAAAITDALEESLKTPERLKIINEAMKAAPLAKMSNVGRAISSTLNGLYLTPKTLSWTLGDSLDKASHMIAATIKRAKNGQAISFDQLFGKEELPADILDNILKTPGQESVRSWGMFSSVMNALDSSYRFNAAGDKLSNAAMYRFFLGSEMAQIAAENKIKVEALTPAMAEIARKRATTETQKYGAAYAFSSALTIHPVTKFAATFLGWYTKSMARTAQVYGEVPEFYKLGSLALQKVRDLNREYPNEYKKEIVKFKDKEFNVFNKLPIFAVINGLSNSYYGDIDSKKDILEQKLQRIQEIQDPVARFKAIDEDPSLLEYIDQKPVKWLGNFVNTLNDMQAIPWGIGAEVLLKKAGQIDERTPHLLPSGRQFNNLARGLGFDMDIEGALIPRVKAYNQNMFDADVANQMLVMKMRGENKKYPPTPEGVDQWEKDATKIVRTRMLKNFLHWSTTGIRLQDAPEIQNIYNAIQDIEDRKYLQLPSYQESNKIREATGIDDQTTIDMVWRAGYMNNQILDAKEAIASDKMAFMRHFPEVPELNPIEEFQLIRANRFNKNREDGAIERTKTYGRIPYRNIKDVMPTDRVARALFYTYGAQEVTDEEGNVIGMKFDFDGKIDNPTRDFVWKFFSSTPDEQLQMYRDRDPRMALVNKLFPRRYAELQAMEPDAVEGYLGGPKGAYPKEDDRHLLKLAPESNDDEVVSTQSEKLWEAMRQLHPENPLEFPTNAWKYFLKGNEKEAEKFIEKSKGVGKKIIEVLKDINPFGTNLFTVSEAGAAETSLTEATGRTISDQYDDPQSEYERTSKQQAKNAINQIAPLFASGTIKNMESARNVLRALAQQNQTAYDMLKHARPRWGQFYAAVDTTTRGQAWSDDLQRMAVGQSLNEVYHGWVADLRDAFRNPQADANEFKQLKKRGEIENDRGVPFMQIFGKYNPALVDELKWRTEGYTYALGKYVPPLFPGNDPAARRLYKEIAFYKPGEKKTEYDKRISAIVSSKENLPDQSYNDIVRLYSDKGQVQVVDALQKLRSNQYTRIPLDAKNQNLVESTRQQVYDNLDDPAALYAYFKQNPETTEIVRQFDPKTYRIVENKIFSKLDNSILASIKASGWNPETIDFYKRHNPHAFNRLFYKDMEFQAGIRQQGIEPPVLDDATSVSVSRFNRVTGQMETELMPSLIAPPEPMPEAPIPDGIFSSFPNMINFVGQRARARASILRDQYERYPERLSQSEVEFINASPESQVFQSFPSVIGQAFREGKLSPQNVVSQFKEIADYGVTTGALDPDSYNQFNTFLTQSSTVLGNTQFGFRLGRFLDDTFNTPRIPINSPTVDFLLAGGPVSDGGLRLETGRYQNRVRLVNPISPNIIGAQPPQFDNLGPTPSNAGAGEAAQAQKAAAGAQVTGTAGTLASMAPASSGLPPLAAVLAVASAAFTVSNIMKSNKARKKQASAARQAEADRARLLQEARNEANSQAEENLQKQLARQRYEQFVQEQQARERDFAERTRKFLREGANFASFAQQPKEFQQRFTQRFEPEVLQFTRRPQFQSRVGLIESIAGRLPRARY